MKTALQKLEKLNKTIEDGLAKVQAAKAAASAQPPPKSGYMKDVAKAAVKGILLAPLVWLGVVLGSMIAYGLASSIAWGMGIGLKFLGLKFLGF